MRSLRAAFLAATILAGWSETARADPISAAILGAVGITAASVGATAFAVISGLTTAAIGFGVNYGLQALMGAFMGRPKTLGGVSAEVNYGADVPYSVPFGRAAIAGQLVYHQSHANSNKILQMIFVLGDWECDGLEGVWVNGEKLGLIPQPIDSGEHENYKIAGYGGHLYLRFFRGTLDQGPDLNVTNTGRPPGRWTVNDTLSGKCYVVALMEYDDDGTFTGIPDFLFEIRGARVYDWRRDSSVGGSGDHRWDDPTTYEWSDNPFVCCYNFMRGLYHGEERMIGMGVPFADLVLDKWTAAANIADEEIEEGGDTEKRYTCSVIVPDDAEWRVAVDSFITAGAGYMVESSGTFGPIAGAAQVPVAALSFDDLLIGHPSQFTAKRNRSEKANAVFGTFRNPAKMWENDSIVPIENPDWEAEDGGEKLVRDLGLDPVYKPQQAARIARIRANETRFEAEFTGVFPLRYYFVEPGDWVTFDCPEGGDRTYIVAEREGAGAGAVKLFLRETAAGVFTNVPVEIPPIEVIAEDPPELVTVISGFTASAVSLEGANNQIRPGILVGWVAPDDIGVREVAIVYRVTGNPAVTQLRSEDPASGSFLIGSDIMADTSYDVRARYVRFPDIQTAWSDWVTVKTTSLYVVQTSRIATDTQEYLDRLQQEILGNELSSLREALATYQESVGQNYQYNMHLQQVVATTDVSFARVTVTTEALAAQDAAFASQMTVVEARANDATAVGVFKIEAESSPAGALARLTALARVDLDSEFKRAGYVIEVFEESPGVLKGRVVFEADQFAVKTSGIPFIPFAVIGADTYINKVIVGDQIKSVNYAEGAGNVPTQGFKLGSDGILRNKGQIANDLFAYGINADFGYFTNGLPNEIPDNEFRVNLGNGVVINGGSIRLGTKYTTYDLTRNSPATNFFEVVPVQPGQKIGPMRFLMQEFVAAAAVTTWYLVFEPDGTAWQLVQDNAGGRTWTYIKDILTGTETDLQMRNPGPAGTKYTFRSGDTISGLRYVRVPDNAVGGRFWLWGAGGRGTTTTTAGGTTRFDGGPGGFVKFDHALNGGEYLGIDVGAVGQGVGGKGFGGRSERRVSGGSSNWIDDVGFGGGFSAVYRGQASRATILGIAGGGGGVCNSTSKAGPGGLTTSTNPAGGNGVSSSDVTWKRMAGIQNLSQLGPYSAVVTQLGPGGGGYEGGGYISTSNNKGRGGSSYVVGSATNVTMTAGAADANGISTSNTAPGSGESVYDAGEAWGSGDGTTSHPGGVVIEWLY